jgi:phosphoglycerol transferase MdoB-like AlkP superfamily enzyme
MRSWFLGNGFSEIIEQKDYKNPNFVATWGVSDEDLVIKANQRFNALYKEGKPFAALMFSSSNHKPFEVPLEKIEPIKPGYNVQNAVKFADYSIGHFFELAKNSPYYKDTVFVVVADHNIRVYGKDVVPVDMFHILAMIIDSQAKPKVYKNLASQPDILATALDLLGQDFSYPILGKSIFSDKKANLNLMQFNENYALRVGNKVAVLVPNKKAQTYIYKDKHLVKTKHDKELERDALAFVTALNYLYDKQKYK